MTQFDESKLSRIMARRIITPEDRSQLLPLCTPIYCPDNMGVKASKVTIIDPNLNTFYTGDYGITIGSEIEHVNEQLPTGVTKTGNPEEVTTGHFKGSATNYYQVIPSVNESATIYIDGPILANQAAFSYINGACNTGSNHPGGLKVVIEHQANGQIKITAYDRVSNMIDIAMGSEGESNFVKGNIEGVIYDYGDSIVGGIAMLGVPAYNRTKTAPNVVKNLIDIDLTQKVEESYFVPYEVDLETDEDLVNVIKSDFAVKFRKAVSNRLFLMLTTLKTAGTISTINMGSSLAEAFGEVLCQFVAEGTGQKYSIYRYNNGAPVVYDLGSEQPNIDKEITNPTEISYVDKDSINVPALHYFEKPTLILPQTQYKNFQTQMCSGGLREYVVNKVMVDTADINWSTLGEGVFGTNDSFAVAFTQPAIKLIPDKDFFGYRLCCTTYYGVQLIHKDNLRLFI